MKKFFFSFLLCFALLEVHGQVNLVPNPSFEERTGCPQGFPDLEGILNDWISFTGTPDYFHNCSEICGYNSNRGFQEPNSGEAFSGFLVYKKSLPNIREHLGIQLTSPLIIGTRYYVSFFVTPAYRYSSQFNLACNKLGGMFTTNSSYFPSGYTTLLNNPQVYVDSIISDTSNWVKIRGSFIADSAYQFLSLGNFFEDQLIDTLEFPSIAVSFESYYFLDDVCVSSDSLYTENWTTLSVSNLSLDIITINPNPASDFLHINSQNKIENIEIYDFFGQLIFSQQNFPNEEYVLNIEKISSGIYFVKIRTEFAETIKKMVKE
jgi:hypothetical protein